MSKNCPECHMTLTNEKKCICGWKKKEFKPTQTGRVNDCSYTTGQHQCQLPGTISRGRGEKGFCLWHWRHIDSAQDARNLRAFSEFRGQQADDKYSRSVWGWPIEKLWVMLTGQQMNKQ